jgi:peroxiredoxin
MELYFFVRKTHNFRQPAKIFIMKKLFLAILLLVVAKSQSQTLQFKVGDKAPNFTAITHAGNKTDLKKLTKNGPVVLIFYRGYWCPFCNKELNNLNDSLSAIQAKGATVVAISPEKYASVNKTIEKTKASFDIISDTSNTILKQYGVNFTVDDKTVEKYKTYGIDFASVNGNSDNTLPVPAVFIIDKNGTFKYLHFDTDYRKRPSVKELLENL